MIIDAIKQTYHRLIANVLYARAQRLANEGLEQECGYVMRGAMRHSFASRPGGTKPAKLNPLVTELHDNWERYGFKSAEEASSYTSWIFQQFLRERTWRPIENIGYNGLKTSAEVLRRYPLESFRSEHNPGTKLDDRLN